MSSSLESHFAPFRKNVIGIDQTFDSPYGQQTIVYADWTASGRLYGPIEKRLTHLMGPFVGNTHTDTTITGSSMTQAYHESLHIIKKHVNADERDVLLTSESGMTGAIGKLQRILGLSLHEAYKAKIKVPYDYRPIVFVTHMEHHSNHTSWLETIAEVVCIGHKEDGLVDLQDLERLLEQYKDRKIKIAAVSAASNVTGIQPPYHEIARMMHQNRGLCFVDFACAGPYVKIDMHPAGDPLAKLDAVYFSPHKFLGGPGTPGVVVFDSKLYTNQVPDLPGGGTVSWTSPWGEHRYLSDIEVREDGGTPPFLQTIRAALAMRLKDQMGVDKMLAREHEIMNQLWQMVEHIPGLNILAAQHKERLGIFSFYIEGLHYNLATRLLNDRYGIQVRGGCSCAGTYGHYLLNISQEKSEEMYCEIERGNNSIRPGWVRMSIHPIMADFEVEYLGQALRELALNHRIWSADYRYIPARNEYVHMSQPEDTRGMVHDWLYGDLIGDLSSSKVH
ncbi:MAG: aminotransferase class V-fold PLP-dependent enzyme [Bacteroidota bacterium]